LQLAAPRVPEFHHHVHRILDALPQVAVLWLYERIDSIRDVVIPPQAITEAVDNPLWEFTPS
jgi:hypothetical protein